MLIPADTPPQPPRSDDVCLRCGQHLCVHHRLQRVLLDADVHEATLEPHVTAAFALDLGPDTGRLEDGLGILSDELSEIVGPAVKV